MDLPAKEQIAAYDLRWPMEKMIRTTKQKFGAMQCQALEESKQRAHIMAGFLAYAILSSIKNDKEKLSVDELVNILRDCHFDDLINAVEKHKPIQRRSMTDPIVKSLLNHLHDLLNNVDQAMHMQY